MKTAAVASILALSASLALAGCASRPKAGPAPAPSAGTPAPMAEAPPRAAPAPQGVQPGSQQDLAATAGERVFFALDSHALDAEARATLARQAAWLARYPQATVIVAGNADERGTREYNLALGARRAEAARQQLVAQGVAAGRIRTVSYGKERPIDTASTEAAWSRNRNAHTALTDAAGQGW